MELNILETAAVALAVWSGDIGLLRKLLENAPSMGTALLPLTFRSYDSDGLYGDDRVHTISDKDFWRQLPQRRGNWLQLPQLAILKHAANF
jgi:hypothetical protein